MGYSRSNPRPVRNLYQQSVQENYKKLEQEKLLKEHQRLEEIRKQNEFMRKQSLMFEKAVSFAASSAAAGAGAGGSGNRRTPASTSAQAVLHYNFDGDTNTLYYFVFDFGKNSLSEIKQVTLDNSPSRSPVTEGGFFLYANNDENSTTDMLFIDLSGNIIWQDSSDNQSDVDIENFTRYVGAYYLKDGNWKLVLFDKDSNIKTFNFGEYRIEGGGYSYNDVWTGGIVVLEEVGTLRKYYIINFEESTSTKFYEVDNDSGDFLNVYQYAYSNKILTRKNSVLWEVFSSSGSKIAEFDAYSTFETSSWSDYDFTFLDDNGSFLIFGYNSDNNNRTITLFSGSENSFSSKTLDTSVYPSYDFDIINQKDYDSVSDRNAEGAAIFLFYDNRTQPDEISYYDAAVLLPIWSTDSQLRDFYTFSSTRGIYDNFDDSDISLSRSADYICLLIDNGPEDENYSIMRLNRTGDVETVISTNVPKNSQLNDDDQINGKTILQFERGVTASGNSWGWSDLSDVEDRFYYSFYKANNGQIGNYVEGQEFIMKDVVNDNYWAIKFTDWQQGGGFPSGGFAYSRQLISGGTYSGDVIYFTFSSFLQQESDVISPGVLELRRNYNGPIYNSAKEGDSNGRNPVGTLWNSEFVYNLSTSYDYKWWSTDGSNPTSSTAFDALFSGTASGSGTTYGSNIDWIGEVNEPGYLPTEDFAWQVECLLKVDVAGLYTFNTSSDDGNELSIDGSVVTSFYGARGINSGSDTSSPINLSTGLHTLRYRMQQGGGGSGAIVRWEGPSDGTFSVIPASNFVRKETLTEYDHYIIGTNGQILGTVSTGDSYDNEYEGKTYILEDRTFGKLWVSNTQNSQNWTLLDKYYEQFDDPNNFVAPDGLRTGTILAQSGFNYRIITEESTIAEFTVPSTGYVNKISSDNIFMKGAYVRSRNESNEWLRFYNINGTLIETIEIPDEFTNFSSWLYGDRCVLSWEQDGTIRYAFFNGDSVTQFDSGRANWNIFINDYIWWD